MSVQFSEFATNLATATKQLAESTEAGRDEVSELRTIVSSTALVARDKVEMVSNSIDRTHSQLIDTTEFVSKRIVVPAREIAAVMAGVRKGLEVRFATARNRATGLCGRGIFSARKNRRRANKRTDQERSRLFFDLWSRITNFTNTRLSSAGRGVSCFLDR